MRFSAATACKWLNAPDGDPGWPTGSSTHKPLHATPTLQNRHLCTERLRGQNAAAACFCRAVPSVAVSSIRTITELRRWQDLAVIRAAAKARLPDRSAATIGLADIAELCKRDIKARPTRDCHDVRDQILEIAIEWDLDRDALDQQSNACLRAVVIFLFCRDADAQRKCGVGA